MASLLKSYERRIQSIALIPSDSGKFEVKVGEQLVYSKLQTGRHVEEQELVEIVGKAL